MGRIPLKATFVQRLVKGSGPYWYARFWREDKMRTAYVGSDEKKREVELAHELVAAELDAAEQRVSPELAELQKLQAIARGGVRRARPQGEGETVDVPILALPQRPK